MMKHLPAIGKTVKGLGVLMDNQRPVVRFMAQNWPLTMLTGYALYRRLMKRRKDKSLSAFTALTDTGLAMTPLAVIAVINVAAGARKVSPEPENIKALPAPEVHGFAGATPPPEFFASKPPHEANAHIPAPAEAVVTASRSPTPSAPASGGPFDSFLS